MPVAVDANLVQTVLFYVFALMTAGAAIGVVISRNIVRMAVFLLFTLTGVAGLYFLLDAEFLAAVQLVVYAGGTLILIIFGVMLTSKSPFSRFEPKLPEVIVATSFSVVLFVALVMGIVHRPTTTEPPAVGSGYPIERFGQALLGDYLVPFEVASVLLLVVMIGAAYLAKRRESDMPVQELTEAPKRAKSWS